MTWAAGGMIGRRSAALLLALPFVALAASGRADGGSAAAPSQAVASELDRAALTERLREVRMLLERITALEAQLAAQAQQALDRADAARNHDERARQERLYGELGARLGELGSARHDIERQLQALERELEAPAPRLE